MPTVTKMRQTCGRSDLVANRPTNLFSGDVAILTNDRVPPYVKSMSHTIKHKSRLLARVKRIKGQLDAIERALEAEFDCTDVLMLVASVRGAVGGLTTELLEDHIRHHVVDPDREKDPKKAKGAADLIDVVRTYLK